jgi:hypothetical protein
MDVSELRTKIRNLLAVHPEVPNGEILGIDTVHEPFGLEVTTPTEIPGINQVFRIYVQEAEARPKRFKPVKADDLFRGVPAAFLLEEED